MPNLDPRSKISDQSALVNGSTGFAFDLYRRLSASDSNLFISPFSISTAMTMAAGGARGQTLQQMNDTLQLPPNPHASVGELLGALTDEQRDKKYDLNIANSMWGQMRYPFVAQYLELLESQYGSPLQEVDFRADPEAARRRINAWVSDTTHDKIDELIGEDIITNLTVLVLVNAIYFKAKWQSPFGERSTRELPFHLDGGNTIECPTMYQISAFRHMQGEGYAAIDLPYESNQLSMTIVLPDETDGLADIEEQLSPRWLKAMDERMESRQVGVKLPKFSTTGQMELVPVLSEMGIRDAFSLSTADFSGITRNEPIAISNVIHEARIDVDEAGTEAAAATAVVFLRSSRPVTEIAFDVNRPFLFLIRDEQTKSVLFLGKIANPLDD